MKLAEQPGLYALTFWAQYAELVARGVKPLETRGWPAPPEVIGQTILIHTAKKEPPQGTRVGEYVVGWLDGKPVLWHWPDPDDRWNTGMEYFPLRTGSVIAKVRLVDCVPIVDHAPHEGPFAMTSLLSDVEVIDSSGEWRHYPRQAPYGIYRSGRYVWIFDEIKRVEEACPAGCNHGAWCNAYPGNCCGGAVGPYEGCQAYACEICGGKGTCEPIPAIGRQKLWKWKPEAA